jgi:Stigma-specific protein, Stig1
MRQSIAKGCTACAGVAVLGFTMLASCSGSSGGGDPPAMTVDSADAGIGKDVDVGNATDGATQMQAPKCEANGSCSDSSLTCCNGFCIDTTKDPNNCGKCGTSCTADQFCTGKSCEDAVISNVCENPNGTVATDAYPEDNTAGSAMGAALSASCMPAVKITSNMQDATGILDPGSGRPITGAGNTLVTGGGGYGQRGVQYMETSITPVYLWGDGTTGEIRRRDGSAIVSTPVAMLTSHHDYFYVQVSVEPVSSTLCFSGVGMLGPGTTAAGYFVSSTMLPKVSTFTKQWYVYEWADTNNDAAPNAGDSFTQVAAGP